MALPKLDAPTYETKLISTGKRVRFRPFLVKEQKLFLMAAESNDPKEIVTTIKQVLRNCILDDLDIETLPTFDLENIFIQMRARSVGEIVNLKYTCNNLVKNETGEEKPCGGLVKYDLNLLEIEPTTNGEHSNKVQLTDKLGVVMKYPNFDILGKINIENESDLVKIIAGCIDYIYDDQEMYYAKDYTEKELNEFIDGMQQADLYKIQKFFETMPRINKKFNFKCPKCNYSEDVTIEGVQNFFG